MFEIFTSDLKMVYCNDNEPSLSIILPISFFLFVILLTFFSPYICLILIDKSDLPPGDY